MQIRDIMNINAIRILSGSTMAKAAELAALSNASGLFVVDDEDNFIPRLRSPSQSDLD